MRAAILAMVSGTGITSKTATDIVTQTCLTAEKFPSFVDKLFEISETAGSFIVKKLDLLDFKLIVILISSNITFNWFKFNVNNIFSNIYLLFPYIGFKSFSKVLIYYLIRI